jgi:hypothetical protein
MSEVVGIGMPLTIGPVAETSFNRNEEEARLLQLNRVSVPVSERTVVAANASRRRRGSHLQKLRK